MPLFYILNQKEQLLGVLDISLELERDCTCDPADPSGDRILTQSLTCDYEVHVWVKVLACRWL